MCVRKESAKRGCIAPAQEHFQPTFVVVLDLGRSENSANATGKRNQNSKEMDGEQTTMVGALAGKPQESSSDSTASCSRRLQVRSSYCRSEMNFSQMPFKDEIPPARRCQCLSELVWTSSRTPQESHEFALMRYPSNARNAVAYFVAVKYSARSPPARDEDELAVSVF